MKNHNELKALMNNLRMAVEEMRKSFGATTSRQQALALMAWIQRTIEPNQACYMPAGMLADDFALYANMKLPPHARVSIDPLKSGEALSYTFGAGSDGC